MIFKELVVFSVFQIQPSAEPISAAADIQINPVFIISRMLIVFNEYNHTIFDD